MKKILSPPFIGFINITSNNPMKRTIPFYHLFISTVLATLLAVAPVTFAAQGPAKPAVKNTFWQVSKHLEMGGSHFQYQSREQVRGLVGLMLEQIPKQAEGEPEGMAVARTIVEVMEQLRGEFGLEEISGTGASSFELAKDLARNRTFTHHYPGQNKGLLWRLFGTQPHVQKVLDIMPRETAALFHTDLDLKSALDWMSAFLKKNHPAQEKMFTEQIDQLNQTIGLQRLLASYGGEAGAAIVLDKAEKLNLPPGTPAMPMPGLLMMLKVKDDTLRMFLEGLIVGAKLGETVKVNGTDMTVMQLPPDANPLQQFGLRFQPALFQAGEYLVLASDPGLATRVMATAKGNVPGLMAAPEFQKYAKGLDLKGNQIRYISPRAVAMGKDTMELMKRSLFQFGAAVTFTSFTVIELIVVLTMGAPLLANSLSDPAGLTVMRVLPDGIATESHAASGLSATGGVPLPLVVAVVGILASMLLPALARAKAKANAIKSVNNIRGLAVAMQAFTEDHNGQLPAADKWCDAILPEAQTLLLYYSPRDPLFVGVPEQMKKQSSYAMNREVAGMNLNDVNPDTVLLYEQVPAVGWNASGGLKDALVAIDEAGDLGLNVLVVTLVDGSSMQVTRAGLVNLRWKP